MVAHVSRLQKLLNPTHLLFILPKICEALLVSLVVWPRLIKDCQKVVTVPLPPLPVKNPRKNLLVQTHRELASRILVLRRN